MRYYCDFCKKSGCGKHAIEQHEKHCTMNPNRQCRMCEIAEQEQIGMEELIKLLPPRKETMVDYGISIQTGGKDDLKALREKTGNCPACILATIRQSGGCGYMYEFYFEEECKSFWADINSEERYYDWAI